MKVGLDTSVLVSALLSKHPNHDAAFAWLSACRQKRAHAVASVHALAELWSVLTKVPVAPRVSPEDATVAVKELYSWIELVPVTTEICLGAIERCRAKKLASGAVFDALHLLSAEASEVDAFLTFNEQDFVRLSDSTRPRIVVPDTASVDKLLEQ